MKNVILMIHIALLLSCDSSSDRSKDSIDETFKNELAQLDEMEQSDDWKTDEPKGNELQCPCCDYYTLERRGAFEICSICFWEDDGIDLTDLDEHSGPNHITLREGRLNFEKFGACDSAMVKHVLNNTQRNKFKFEKRIIE